MKLTPLILTPFLILIGLNAQPVTGTTLGHYSKPGAPIDMSYISNHVNKNETTDINITLTTTVRTGNMNVLLNFENELKQESNIPKEINFKITPNKKKYFINLKISSSKDGLYYIRLLTKIDKGLGSKMRAFAVPIFIGEKPKRKNSTIIMKASSGENISISQAVETIEVLKEK
jgi:hypothetical protein